MCRTGDGTEVQKVLESLGLWTEASLQVWTVFVNL